jgi:hypothetical protein
MNRTRSSGAWIFNIGTSRTNDSGSRSPHSRITVPSRPMQLPTGLALYLDCVFGNESSQEILGEPLHIVPLGVLVVA